MTPTLGQQRGSSGEIVARSATKRRHGRHGIKASTPPTACDGRTGGGVVLGAVRERDDGKTAATSCRAQLGAVATRCRDPGRSWLDAGSLELPPRNAVADRPTCSPLSQRLPVLIGQIEYPPAPQPGRFVRGALPRHLQASLMNPAVDSGPQPVKQSITQRGARTAIRP